MNVQKESILSICVSRPLPCPSTASVCWGDPRRLGAIVPEHEEAPPSLSLISPPVAPFAAGAAPPLTAGVLAGALIRAGDPTEGVPADLPLALLVPALEIELILVSVRGRVPEGRGLLLHDSPDGTGRVLRAGCGVIKKLGEESDGGCSGGKVTNHLGHDPGGKGSQGIRASGTDAPQRVWCPWILARDNCHVSVSC